MDQQFLTEMREQLLGLKQGILDRLIQEDNELTELSGKDDPMDSADLASFDIERRTLETLGHQELKRLQQIDSALGRIQSGKYGYCLKSGKLIPTERLRAIPYALYTVEAQAALDRQRRVNA